MCAACDSDAIDMLCSAGHRSSIPMAEGLDGRRHFYLWSIFPTFLHSGRWAGLGVWLPIAGPFIKGLKIVRGA